MKGRFKRMTIYLISLCELILLAFATLGMSGHIDSHFGFVVLGLLGTVAAIPLHCLGKRCRLFYLCSIAVNTCSSALFCAMYYTATEQSPQSSEFLLALIGGAAVLTAVYVFIHIFPKYSAFVGIFGILVSIGIGIYDIVMWVKDGGALYSFGFFSMVIALMCLFAMMSVNETPTEHATRYASFGSFGIFIIIATVVLFILSEGELLEGVFEVGAEGIGDIFGSSKKKKK